VSAPLPANAGVAEPWRVHVARCGAALGLGRNAKREWGPQLSNSEWVSE